MYVAVGAGCSFGVSAIVGLAINISGFGDGK